MKQSIFFKSIRCLILASVIMGMFTFQSCSDENLVEPNSNSESLKIDDSAQFSEMGRPYPVDGTFSVQADLVSAVGGCYTVNVRVYITYGGQQYLIANSDVQVGNGCPQRFTGNGCAGEYNGDYFLGEEPDSYGNCLSEFFDKYPDAYDEYIALRQNLTGI